MQNVRESAESQIEMQRTLVPQMMTLSIINPYTAGGSTDDPVEKLFMNQDY